MCTNVRCVCFIGEHDAGLGYTSLSALGDVLTHIGTSCCLVSGRDNESKETMKSGAAVGVRGLKY